MPNPLPEEVDDTRSILQAAALVCVAIVGLALLRRLARQYWRRGGEPPLFPGVPFIGHAIAFGTDYLALLRAKLRAAGDAAPVVTLYVAGDRMHFLAFSHDFASVLRERDLEFDPIGDAVMRSAFGMQLDRESQDAIDWLTTSPHQYAWLRGKPLVPLLAAIGEQLDAAIEEHLSQLPNSSNNSVGGWVDVPDLYLLVRQITWRATGRVLYGELFTGSGGADSSKQQEEEQVRLAFEAFDKHFPLLLAGVPASLLSGCTQATAVIRQRFLSAGPSIPGAVASPIMGFRQSHLFRFVGATKKDEQGKKGGSVSDFYAFQIAMVWAVFANTMPAAFWSLYWSARDPRCAEACATEAAAAAAQSPPGAHAKAKDDDDADDANDAGAQADADATEKVSPERLPHINAAVNEALRLCVASLTVRRASRDMQLHLKGSNATVPIRKGDRVALAPALTHMDDALFAEATAFDHTRFLGDRPLANLRGANGKPVGASVALQPFGGGVSMCPGRHLAQAEIRSFLLLMHQAYEIDVGGNGGGGSVSADDAPRVKLGDPGVPRLDMTRAGLGILPPVGAVPCRIRRRASAGHRGK